MKAVNGFGTLVLLNRLSQSVGQRSYTAILGRDGQAGANAIQLSDDVIQ
jgi:hypothetical protein